MFQGRFEHVPHVTSGHEGYGEHSILCERLFSCGATISLAKNFKISSDQTGLTRSAVLLNFPHRCAHVFKGPERIRLFLRTLVLYRIMFPSKHRRGGRDVERSVAHLCWFEATVKQEAAFGTDERSTDFGHYWFHVADVHDHSPLPVTLRRY